VCCGRRFGKTYLIAAECVRTALGYGVKHDLAPRVWIVGPTYKVANEDWSMPGGVLDLAKPAIKSVNRTDRIVYLLNGGIIEVRTADREDNLRGGGLDLLAIDEAGQISEPAWMALRPTVSDRRGRVLRAGTPKGRNWWYREWMKGRPGPDHAEHYQSWQIPSCESPYFPAEEWDNARTDLPADWFRQEYEAQFLVDQAAVFRGLERCLVGGEFTKPDPQHRYVHGLDIAKQQDFSVLVTVDAMTKRIVHVKRLQRVEYLNQAETFNTIINKYGGGGVWADATGVGPALIEPLRVRGADVHNFQFTAQSKRELVGNLIVGIESRELSIPQDGDMAVLVREMQDFEYKLSGTGQPQYGAPEGMHDDCVYALALAYWGLHKSGGGTFVSEPNY